MKRIDAVIRRDQFGKVKKALSAAGCPGMMIFTFRGHGRQGGIVENYGGRKFRMDLLPKVLITVFVNDYDLKKIVGVVAKAARTGAIGDGKIFVTPVENAVRIRTGEEGAAAI